MFFVETDRSKRFLVISVVGHVTKGEVKEAAQEVRKLVQAFAPGFRALADFRWLESMDSSAAPHIAEIMDALAEKKVATVIRVISDPQKDIGLNILSHFHYGPEIQVVTVETMAEALQRLTENES
jgi:NADPH-dependent ferric siderophore reductase